MRLRQDGSGTIVFAFAYAASDREAVGRVIGELAAGLRRLRRALHVVKISSAPINDVAGSLNNDLRRSRSEPRSVVRLLAVVLRDRVATFASIDGPHKLPLDGPFAWSRSRRMRRALDVLIDDSKQVRKLEATAAGFSDAHRTNGVGFEAWAPLLSGACSSIEPAS